MHSSVKIAALFACVLHPAFAAETFTPQRADPLTEKWRRQTIQELDSLGLYSMTEAKDGVLWFGLRNGVIRYNGLRWQRFFQKKPGEDGLRFKLLLAARDGAVYASTDAGIYKYAADQWRKIIDAQAQYKKMLESSDGSIWLLNDNGLTQIQNDQATEYTLGNNKLDDMQIDTNQNIWIIEYRTGNLRRYPIQNGKLQLHKGRTIAYPYGVSGALNYFRIAITNECVWVSSISNADDLRCYGTKSRTWKEIDLKKYGGDTVHFGIQVDREGSVWVLGKYTLNVYRNKQWTIYQSSEFDLPSDPYQFMQTADGSIWLGGQYTKLQRIDYGDTRWGQTYVGLHFQCESPANTRWFLEATGKIVVQHINTNAWQMFNSDDGVISTAMSILCARDGSVWVSGSHNNTAAISRYDSKQWHRDLHPNLSKSISPLSALETGDGKILFSSLDRKTTDDIVPRHAGIIVYSKNNGDYTFKHLLPPAVPEVIHTITQDQNQTIWMTYRHRVFKFADGQSHAVSPQAGLSQSRHRHIAATEDGHIWIASERNGVFSFDGKHWQNHTHVNGLPSNVVSHLLPLNDGSVIAATARGLSRFDGQTWMPILSEIMPVYSKHSMVKHDGNDGLWINIAYRNWYQTPRQTIHALQGEVNVFRTLYYRFDQTAPNTLIETFSEQVPYKGFNHVYWSGQDAWALGNTQSLHYSFRLNRGAWSPFDAKQRQILDKLHDGRYTLEVRARDNDFNIDPTPARISFSVSPPLWRQTWIQITTIAAIALITFFIIFIIRIRERHLMEIAEVKTRFFTHVSHELRTPLTLILGPLEELLATNQSGDQRKTLKMVIRNAERLMSLIDQLLDFRRLEAGKMQIDTTTADIVDFFNNVAESFQYLAEQKQIDYRIVAPEQNHIAYFDIDKLEKILNNLISNAIKFTPKQGSVEAKLFIKQQSRDNANVAEFIVEDSGIGIDKNQIGHIFDPFYRANNPNLYTQGSGIGLSLTKEFVELCNGELEVVSPIDSGKGARFTVRFPLLGAQANDYSHSKDTLLSADLSPAIVNDDLAVTSEKPSVLIIEDDKDLQRFIADGLAGKYRVLAANDGKTGLKIANDEMPNLIVTDIMMPHMDGMELCHRLKHNQITSHIPIIILSARGSLDSQLEGFKTGADDYVTKPFKMPLLIARIESLLASREQLRQQFAKNISLQPSKLNINGIDEQFLQRAMAIVERHIDDPEFTVEKFANEIELNRRTLYVKIKALTDLSVQTFIKTLRLERGMQLLQDHQLSVSEVADRTGFLDLSYFSRCFKEHFGISPTQVTTDKQHDTGPISNTESKT